MEAFILHLTQKLFCPWFMIASHAAEGTITVFKMKSIASHKLQFVNSAQQSFLFQYRIEFIIAAKKQIRINFTFDFTLKRQNSLVLSLNQTFMMAWSQLSSQQKLQGLPQCFSNAVRSQRPRVSCGLCPSCRLCCRNYAKRINMSLNLELLELN